MSKYVDERKVYKLAKEIWKKHFAGIMSFDEYYAQVKNDIIIWFSMPDYLKPIFENYKKKLVRMVYHRLNELENKKIK